MAHCPLNEPTAVSPPAIASPSWRSRLAMILTLSAFAGMGINFAMSMIIHPEPFYPGEPLFLFFAAGHLLSFALFVPAILLAARQQKLSEPNLLVDASPFADDLAPTPPMPSP